MKFITLEQAGINLTTTHRGLPSYPDRLAAFLGDQAPPTLWMAGRSELLERINSGADPSLGLLASVGSPLRLLDSVLTLIGKLGGLNCTFVGGFHSRVERSCLDLLLKQDRRAIVCLARTLIAAKVPPHWQRPLAEGKLLILSFLSGAQRRPTAESAQMRNWCVAGLASSFLVPYASPGSKTEALSRALLDSGKPVWVLDVPANQLLLGLGAQRAESGLVEGIKALKTGG